MMEVSKVLLYCTMAEPFLIKGAREYVLRNHNQVDAFTPPSLNGFVCFECECKEAFNIKAATVREYHSLLNRSQLTEKQFWEYVGSKKAYALHFEQIKAIENPFPITDLYSDEACTKPLKRAPQSWGYAYRKIYIDEEEVSYVTDDCDPSVITGYVDCLGNPCLMTDCGCFYQVEKVLVFSIQSLWCCKYGNGEKDLEIRKTLAKELKGGAKHD